MRKNFFFIIYLVLGQNKKNTHVIEWMSEGQQVQRGASLFIRIEKD